MSGLPAGTVFTTNAPLPEEDLICKRFLDTEGFLPITNLDLDVNPESSQYVHWNANENRWDFMEDYGGGLVVFGYITKEGNNSYKFTTINPFDEIKFILIGTVNGQFFNGSTLLRIDAEPIANRCRIEGINAYVYSTDVPLPARETVFFKLFYGAEKISPRWNEFEITKSHDGVYADGGIVDDGYSFDFGITSGNSSGNGKLFYNNIKILSVNRNIIDP